MAEVGRESPDSAWRSLGLVRRALVICWPALSHESDRDAAAYNGAIKPTATGINHWDATMPGMPTGSVCRCSSLTVAAAAASAERPARMLLHRRSGRGECWGACAYPGGRRVCADAWVIGCGAAEAALARERIRRPLERDRPCGRPARVYAPPLRCKASASSG